MFPFPNSVKSQVVGKTYANLSNDPIMAPYIRNIYPLTNSIKNLTRRRKVRTLGKGSFGRVNLEQIENGPSDVATKYFLNNDDLEQNISEIAVLQYLKGYPNVAQYIGLVSKNAEETNLPFPGIVMAKAHSSLFPRELYRSWNDIYKTIVDILYGYYVLHSLGLAHRDTKPDNMLVTSTGEHWITDFGNSRYISPHIALEDGYTGTIWYSSPEILLQSFQGGRRSCNWFANDCWAVGCSIIEILTGTSIFRGNEHIHVLQTIFSVKGKPTEEDGELYSIYMKNIHIMGSVYVTPYNPKTLQNYIVRNCAFAPPNSDTMDSILVMLEGLTIKNPEKRLTILEALQILGNSPTPISRPLSYANFVVFPLVGENARFMDIICNWIHKISNKRYSKPFSYTMSLSSNTKHIVLDRTFVYLYSLLKTNTSLSFEGDFIPIGITSFIVASCLYDSSAQGFSLEFAPYITDHSVSLDAVTKCMQNILTSNIPLFGKTILDEMIERSGYISIEDQQKLGFINIICFQKMLYQTYRNRIEELIDVVVQFVKQDSTLLVSGGKYFQDGVFLGWGKTTIPIVLKIVDHIETTLGDNRISVTKTRRKGQNLKFR